ncbi:transcriptional regulator, AraC family [Pimelobacter simplex]|uniref:Transcriptional regulator, AraC family n=1 Tax=Nocardioides simplex TaxID=2045 RepID=A0A0A1DPE4_NOCSI|nr:transcriptional regulator, AraC family [Pimelobacter simplex]SFM34355.1 AraC-type DNA-binding protein [Pimelobacter simplex]
MVPLIHFESDELERTEEFLSTHYAPMRIGRTGPRARAKVVRTAAEAISVDRVDFPFDMSYDVEPLGRICLCDIASGTIEGHGPAGSRPDDFGAGELFSLAPPERAYRGEVKQATYSITMLDPAVLGLVAAPAAGQDGVALLDHRPLDTAAGARVRAAIDHLDRAVLSDPGSAGNPLVVGAATRYLAAQVLAAFPSTSAAESAGDRRDAHPAALRRAIDYIEERAGSDLSPGEIAAAAHVSIRSLQLAFRRHLDTTPMRYVNDVRMRRVHGELSASTSGEGAGVAEIASRWGFVHQGHFGQAYRRAYDETPGATLRRDAPAG